jgi:hypothetical protein
MSSLAASGGDTRRSGGGVGARGSGGALGARGSGGVAAGAGSGRGGDGGEDGGDGLGSGRPADPGDDYSTGSDEDIGRPVPGGRPERDLRSDKQKLLDHKAAQQDAAALTKSRVTEDGDDLLRTGRSGGVKRPGKGGYKGGLPGAALQGGDGSHLFGAGGGGGMYGGGGGGYVSLPAPLCLRQSLNAPPCTSPLLTAAFVHSCTPSTALHAHCPAALPFSPTSADVCSHGHELCDW